MIILNTQSTRTNQVVDCDKLTTTSNEYAITQSYCTTGNNMWFLFFLTLVSTGDRSVRTSLYLSLPPLVEFADEVKGFSELACAHVKESVNPLSMPTFQAKFKFLLFYCCFFFFTNSINFISAMTVANSLFHIVVVFVVNLFIFYFS